MNNQGSGVKGQGLEHRAQSTEHILQLKNISKSYKQGSSELHILKDVSLEINKGEVVALVGPSGCGKTTLLQIAGLLDKADSGGIIIDNIECNKLSDNRRTELRRSKIGFIYQFHHLLPDFSALENVVIPQSIAGISKKDAKIRAEELLAKVGLGERLKHRPGELSGGEQQRVAIARALANNPALLLADEPTGNLDPDTAKSVFDSLLAQARDANLSIFIVTHNMELASKAKRVITFKNGILR